MRPAALVLVLAACASTEELRVGVLEMPSAAAVLPTDNGSPWEEPVGVVSNGTNGLIYPLALKQGRFLNDDPTAAFLRGNPLATGDDRFIGALAAWTDGERVAIFAADHAFGHLLEIPWITGLDARGAPVEQEVTSTTPVQLDQFGDAIDRSTLAGPYVRAGYTSTEDWVVSYDGDQWWAVGSRSGRQEPIAHASPWYGHDHNLELEITGSPERGDRFEFSTSSGIVEHDLGGTPIALAMAPDMSLLAVVIEGDAGPALHTFDPDNAVQLGAVRLPSDARPHRMAWADDGTALYVSDTGRTAAWQLSADGTGVPVEIPMPTPTIDVAVLGSTLYAVSLDGQTVWLYDLDAGAMIDVNVQLEGVQGARLRSAVQGIASLPVAYAWPERDDDGVQRWGRSVAVTLYSGEVMFIAEATGCLLSDGLGPRTYVSSSLGSNADYTSAFDGVAYGPYLEQNAANDRHVLVNQCAGIARSEKWTLTYDAIVQGWRVTGNYSGDQVGIAYEDKRYQTDDASLSFLIRAGSTITQDGWVIEFDVVDGAMRATGDNNFDGDFVDEAEASMSNLGDPVGFHYRVGPDDDDWQTVDDRPYVLVFAQGNDFAARVQPQTGRVDALFR